MSGYEDIARRQRLAAKLGLQGDDYQYIQGVEDAVEAVAAWLEDEAVRVEALVEANTDVRDWRETASLEAGARSLRSTLGHLRRELPGEEGPCG